MDHEVVDLSVLGVHQDSAAFAACEVDRVITGVQDGRGAYHVA
jgi:hypothetical protein